MMYAIRTNLQFQPDGSIKSNPDRSPNAIFSLLKNKNDAHAIAAKLTALWEKSVRKWDPVKDIWCRLSEEEEKVKPLTLEVSPDQVAGWPMNYAISTGLVFKMTYARWEIDTIDSNEIIAIFRRFDDAKAVANYMDRLWIKKLESSEILSSSDDIRPVVVKLTSLPEWAVEVDD